MKTTLCSSFKKTIKESAEKAIEQELDEIEVENGIIMAKENTSAYSAHMADEHSALIAKFTLSGVSFGIFTK